MPSYSTAPLDDALTLARAAELLSSGRGSAGERLRFAVEAQLVRRGVAPGDRDDVRAEVAYALLVSQRTGSLTLAAAAAHAARVARNKAIDHHRRLLREAPAGAIADRTAALPDGSLQAGLDAVSGEVHRRDVASALVDLVRGLPLSERLALTATATGSGHLGSGLGRSSHYRALDRARLRLHTIVRSRVAAGLALPAVLARMLDHLRPFLLPAGATAAAVLASAAFVLPAVETPSRAAVAPAASAQLAPARSEVARVSRPAPAVRIVHRRVGATTRVAAIAVHRATRVRARARVIERPAPTPAAVTPAPAGLAPCRAALLCQ